MQSAILLSLSAGFAFELSAIIALVGGTVFVMWLACLFVSIPSSTLVGIILAVAYIFVIVKLYEEDEMNDQITYYEEPTYDGSEL